MRRKGELSANLAQIRTQRGGRVEALLIAHDRNDLAQAHVNHHAVLCAGCS